VPIILVIAVINKNTIVTAIRIALGFLCTLCVVAAAETGNISAKPAPIALVKQSSAIKPALAIRSTKSKPVDLALTRHTSTFKGPPGPTLAVGARYVLTPTPGLSRLDNFGQISKGEYVYDWPPGAKIIAAAPVAVTPAISPTATDSAQSARR
jgi:hypothetical protein